MLREEEEGGWLESSCSKRRKEASLLLSSSSSSIDTDTVVVEVAVRRAFCRNGIEMAAVWRLLWPSEDEDNELKERTTWRKLLDPQQKRRAFSTPDLFLLNVFDTGR